MLGKFVVSNFWDFVFFLFVLLSVSISDRISRLRFQLLVIIITYYIGLLRSRDTIRPTVI